MNDLAREITVQVLSNLPLVAQFVGVRVILVARPQIPSQLFSLSLFSLGLKKKNYKRLHLFGIVEKYVLNVLYRLSG